MAKFAKKLRMSLEALVAHGFYAFFAALSVDQASAFGGKLARLIGPHLKVSGVARRNLAQAFPHWPNDRIEDIVRQTWDNLGRVAGEFPHIETLTRERLEVVGLENMQGIQDDGLPALFFSGHLGNWELNSSLSQREGIDLHLIYREANNPAVEALYRKARKASANSQIAKGPQGARQVLEILRKNGNIGMLMDQKMNDGIAVPFFGRDAMTAPALAQFALRYRCPVIPTCVERLNGAHFRMTLFPPLVLPNSGDRHADVAAITATVNTMLETWIRANPGQWLWLHKRWPN